MSGCALHECAAGLTQGRAEGQHSAAGAEGTTISALSQEGFLMQVPGQSIFSQGYLICVLGYTYNI